MTPYEMKKMIKKLSRRRHNLLKYLLMIIEYPHSKEKEIRKAKSDIEKLTKEIEQLLVRLST